MGTLKNVIMVLGAPGLFAAAIVTGYNVFYAEAPGFWLGIAALGGPAVFLGLRRRFAGMWLYAAALLLFLVVYPRLGGLESYTREGRMRGRLYMLRQQIMLRRSETGAWPQDAAGLYAEDFELRAGHRTPRAVQAFNFARENYLWPPGGPKETLNIAALEAGAPEEEAIRRSWSPGAPDPLFLYPGKEFNYRVTRDKGGALVSSGSFKSPVPEGFDADSGAVVYDPSTGHVFINCVHRRKQDPADQWWKD